MFFMKKIKILVSLLVTACAFSISACKSNKESMNSSSLKVDSSNPIVQEIWIQDWREKDKEKMQQYLTEVLPLAPLTNEYVLEENEDENGEYLYIYDEKTQNICSTYGDILVKNAYMFVQEDATNGVYIYMKALSVSEAIIVQIDYFVGNSEFAPCFEIVAYLLIAVNDEVITDWNEETKTLMNEKLGIVLPVAPLTSNYMYESYIDEEDGAEVVYIYDENVENVCDEYATLLLAQGYTFLLEDEGAFLYFIDNGDSTLCVQIDYFEGNELFDPCFEIYAWNSKKDEVYPSWPTELINEELKSLNLQLPAYTQASEYGFISYSDDSDVAFLVSVYGVDETSITTYSNLLKAANWTLLGSDDSGYFSAISPSSEYVISYYYNQELSVYFDTYTEVPSLQWPALEIKDYLNNEEIEIPSYDGIAYTTTISNNYLVILVSTNSTDCENEYKTILENHSWIVDSSNYDEYGHYALDATGTYELYFYYQNNYLVISIQKPTAEAVSSIQIVPTSFSSASYAANNGTKIFEDFLFVCNNIMNQGGKIQMKKNASYFYNEDALTLSSIEILNGSESIKVYGCSTSGDKVSGVLIVADTQGVYNLTGYSYFYIEAVDKVGTMEALTIHLAA